MTSPAPVDPSRTALLVMDYQPAILGNCADPTALLTRAEVHRTLMDHVFPRQADLIDTAVLPSILGE